MGGATVCPFCGGAYPADLDEVNDQGRHVNRSRFEKYCDCEPMVLPSDELASLVLDDVGTSDIAAILAEDWYEKQRALGRVLVNQEDLTRLISEAHSATYPEKKMNLERAIDRVIDGQYDILNDPGIYVY